jgi:tripartite-type tricarboxylate transporter receptor subunit TctC
MAYTIGYANVVTLAINRSLYAKQPYDPDRDLQLIAMTNATYNMLAANNALPGQISEGIDRLCKEIIPQLLTRQQATATTGHLGRRIVQVMTGTQIVHVPVQGQPAGHPGFDRGPGADHVRQPYLDRPTVKSGRCARSRCEQPETLAGISGYPAIAETVPGYETNAWGGVIAPAGVPKPIIASLNAEINQALASKTLKERYAATDTERSVAHRCNFASTSRKRAPNGRT